MDVRLLYGFNPQAGDGFDVLLAEVAQGTFGTALLPTLDPGLAWTLQYLTDPEDVDIVRLSVQPVPLPAAVWMFGGALALLRCLWRTPVSRFVTAE